MLPSVLLALLVVCTESVKIDIALQHALGEDEYTTAGVLSGNFKTQARYQSHPQVLELDRAEPSQALMDGLKQLVQADGLYKLRVEPQEAANASVMTSIPARCLVRQGCVEQLDVHVADNGAILGFHYAFPLCPCMPEHRSSGSMPPSWRFPETSPAPVWMSKQIPPLTLLPRPEEKKPAAARPGPKQPSPLADPETGEAPAPPPEDKRSFLQKNWMLILPLAFLVVNVLGGGMSQPAAQGQARQSSRAAR